MMVVTWGVHCCTKKTQPFPPLQVMFHCTKKYGVRLHAFDPRRMNSYCYKPCGCRYTDEDILTKVRARGEAGNWEGRSVMGEAVHQRWRRPVTVRGEHGLLGMVHWGKEEGGERRGC